MKKAAKESRPTTGGQKAFELKQIRNRLPYIPEPTYHFEVGESACIGFLQDVVVVAILDEGKIYEIDYTSIHNNLGNPVRNEHQRMYVTWTSIRKVAEISGESYIQNDDIRLRYSQGMISSLFSKAYEFGLNLNPDYQRDFVWELEDKVALIDSIFNNVDIGKFTFTTLSAQEWIKTGYSYEVIDSKQRIGTILEYYEDRFEYKGKRFSQLSKRDQSHFENYSIAVAETERLTKEQTLRYFINLNTRGKGMSPEHLEKVRGMLNAYAHSA